MKPLPRLLLLTTLLAAGPRPAPAADWPRWRGPALDGISAETDWTTAWPGDGPRQLWQANVGTGFSSVSVAGGRLYTLGNKDDQDTVYCFDAVTGAPVWKHGYPHPLDPKYYEGGSSSTPTVDGETVFTLSRRGHLFAFDAATGKVRWTTNVAEATGARLPEWGFAGSPLVDGDRLILNVGTSGTAVDKRDGKILWTTGQAAAGYASAVPIQLGGRRHHLIFAADHLAAVAAEDGKVAWTHPWKTSYDVNAADPIVLGADRIFISSGYGRGAALLRLKEGGPAVVWENKNMRNQMNPGLLRDGHLYAIDGNERGKDTTLRCLDLATGQPKWSFRDTAHGAVMMAGEHLIALSEKGELIVGRATPEGFTPAARAQVLGGKCWTVPVLSHGRLYVRNAAGDLVCLDLRATRTAGVK